MFMNVKSVRLILSLATAMVVAASVGFARSWFGKSSTKSYSVTLDSAARLWNGTELQAGNYTVKVPENTQTPEVEFYSGGRLVAKEQAKVQSQSVKNDYTALELNTKGNTNVITGVDLEGCRRSSFSAALTFSLDHEERPDGARYRLGKGTTPAASRGNPCGCPYQILET